MNTVVLPGVAVIALSNREQSTKIAESKTGSLVQTKNLHVRSTEIRDDTRVVSKIPKAIESSLFLPLS